MQIHHIPELRNPIMIIAFTGWNDAGEAASAAVDHLLEAWSVDDEAINPVLIADLEAED